MHGHVFRIGKLEHLTVELQESASDIDHQDQALEACSICEIGFEQHRPVSADRGGDFREAVTRQVDQSLPFPDIEKIDELGPPGRLAGFRKLPAIHDSVDRAGFARI